MARVLLKQGREEAPSRGHPWVFSGAIERVEGEIEAGGIVDLFSHAGAFLGRGYYNPRSQIAVRLLARQPVAIDKAFFRGRMEAALALRKPILSAETAAGARATSSGAGTTISGAGATNSCRLIHAEGDLLPGLICDKYGDYLVLQINTAGMEQFRDEIISLLKELLAPTMMYDRSDAATRAQEGLPDSTGPIVEAGAEVEAEGGPLASGPLANGSSATGAAFPDHIEIRENGIRFLVDVKQGQKTGFYLDQRDNRSLIRGLAQGKRVLNCFSYTGGFSVYASLGGATAVTSVEASAGALELCKENLILNDIPLEGQRLVKGDVFQFLRDDQDEYDLIILDPPAFAKRKGQVKGAIRGYKDINLFAMKRTKKGGLILTCSCSQHIDADLFQKILSYAAVDAGRQLQVLGLWGAPPDHPTALHHPEGAYLKAFLLRVVE
ncbi:MAG: class I SAM-dependent rRNA methyltransferase [Deltaproteobacteria bacterium]|nr:class I SAM-dependent rRNA methyltransferase [Deltaproteobacteria bacterium]